jgi:hypothetical protein
MIHVIGGCYREVCMSPEVAQFYGSAGRAATAIAARDRAVTLHTLAGPRSEREARRLAALGGFEARIHKNEVDVSFGYIHPLQSWHINPGRGTFDASARLHVDAPDDVALVFGMFEGKASATARTIIYDPQDGQMPVPYALTGCRASERLAIIMNSGEALRSTGAPTVEDAGRLILRENDATIVIVKSGARGSLVFTELSEAPQEVPAYFSRYMFGIGSGDIFAAAFAYFWGDRREDAGNATAKASKAVSHYVETRSDRLASDDELTVERQAVSVVPGQVYLAAPFFNMSQRWLVEETRDQLLQIGLQVFSPIHEVGRGDAHVVAARDLAGLEQSDRVFAILDGLDSGTMFEIGYARKMGIPVYAYAELIDADKNKMISGSGCRLINDYATAVYHTAWKC